MNLSRFLEGDKEGTKIKYIESLSPMLEGICKKVSIKTGINLEEVKRVAASQFAIVRKVIDVCDVTDDFDTIPSIRIKHLGEWFPSFWKYKKFRKILKIEE